MSDISTALETIRTAVYGKDMRQAIYDSILHLSLGNATDIRNIIVSLNPDYVVAAFYITLDENGKATFSNPIMPANFNYDLWSDGIMIWKEPKNDSASGVLLTRNNFTVAYLGSNATVEITVDTEEVKLASNERLHVYIYHKPLSEMSDQMISVQRRLSTLETIRPQIATAAMGVMKAMLPDAYTAIRTIPVEDFTLLSPYGLEYTFSRPIDNCDFDPAVDRFGMWVILEDGTWVMMSPDEHEYRPRITNGNVTSYGNRLKFTTTSDSIKLWIQSSSNTHVAYVLFFTHSVPANESTQTT